MGREGAAVNFLGFLANPEQHGGEECGRNRQARKNEKKSSVLPKGFPPRMK